MEKKKLGERKNKWLNYQTMLLTEMGIKSYARTWACGMAMP